MAPVLSHYTFRDEITALSGVHVGVFSLFDRYSCLCAMGDRYC